MTEAERIAAGMTKGQREEFLTFDKTEWFRRPRNADKRGGKCLNSLPRPVALGPHHMAARHPAKESDMAIVKMPQATYQIVRTAVPAGPLSQGQKIELVAAFDAPPGMRLVHTLIAKESSVIGAPHQALLIFEGMREVDITVPDDPADAEPVGAGLPDISALSGVTTKQ